MPDILAESFGLPEACVAAVRDVFSRHGHVAGADIYGSRAKGNFRSGSDIDLTLYGEALTSQDLLRIAGEIDDLMLPHRVDLSLHAQIDDESLRSHIARVGKAFYRATSAAGGS